MARPVRDLTVILRLSHVLGIRVLLRTVLRINRLPVVTVDILQIPEDNNMVLEQISG